MVYYYSAGGRTKIFAEALGSVLKAQACELESDLGKKINFGFIARALWLAVRKKESRVLNMPDKIEAEEIYVCSPVWGGAAAGPVLYFLRNAGLKNKKVNLLLTYESTGSCQKYQMRGRALLESVDCVAGRVLMFATTKAMPEYEVAVSQMKEILEAE